MILAPEDCEDEFRENVVFDKPRIIYHIGTTTFSPMSRTDIQADHTMTRFASRTRDNTRGEIQQGPNITKHLISLTQVDLILFLTLILSQTCADIYVL